MPHIQRLLFTFTCVATLLSSSPVNAGTGNPATPRGAATTKTMSMPMVAPLFLETGEFSSTLHMVNGLTVPATAKVTLFDLNGTQITEQEFKFDPDSERHLDIRQVLDEIGSPVVMGSLRVEPLTDHGMGILAQLAITHHGARNGYFDEELAMPSESGSQMLRAVADNGGAAVVVSIANIASNAVQNVTILGIGESGTTTKTIRLLPNQTKLIRPCTAESQDRFDGSVASDFGNLAKSSSAACGVSIATDGMPGELAAYGIAYHPAQDQGYFSAMTFSDPKVLRSPGFVYPGVPIGTASLLPDGNYAGRLILANFGTRASQVSVQYASTNNAQTHAQALATISLPANSTKITDFTKLTGDPGLQNSFVVRSDTGPGVVLSKLVSFGDGALREVEIIGKDEKQLENTGNHPWSIEEGVASTLILFNHAATAQTFFVKVGGDRLIWRKDYKLAPMETKAISINGLISSEEKDDKGKTLPKDMHRGEVVWLAPHTSEVSGRILQSDKLLAMARNFSCGTCGFLCGGLLSPDSSLTTTVGTTGDLGDITPDFCDVPCQTYTSCPSGSQTMSGTTYYSWSGGGSVASLISGGTSAMSTWKGTGAGYTTVTYAMTMGEGSGYQCTGTSPVTVQTPTASRIVQTLSSKAETSCASGQAGWYRQVLKIVTDQNSADIVQSGQNLTEKVTVTTPNQLNISGVQTGTAVTNSSGNFTDTFFVCSPKCPGTGQTDASQTISDTLASGSGPYNLSPNALVYKCSGITVNGQ